MNILVHVVYKLIPNLFSLEFNLMERVYFLYTIDRALCFLYKHVNDNLFKINVLLLVGDGGPVMS